MAGLLKRRQRLTAEVPTASMADVAFLLLIFFLAATTIDVDKGIVMQLPPKLDENVQPPPVKERNMLQVFVNGQGQLLVEDRPLSVNQLREEVKKHVLNSDRLPDYSESPNQAVVSIKTERGTRYDAYISVLDEVWMAYRDMWNAEARKRGYETYDAFRANYGPENEIHESIKPNISIAEPDPVGVPAETSADL